MEFKSTVEMRVILIYWLVLEAYWKALALTPLVI